MHHAFYVRKVHQMLPMVALLALSVGMRAGAQNVSVTSPGGMLAQSQGYGINNLGVQTGSCNSGSGGATQAVRFLPNRGPRAIFPAGTAYSRGVAINDAGASAGYYSYDGFDQGIFYWSETTGLVDGGMPADAYYASPLQVDSAGEVAGYGYNSSYDYAFIWTVAAGYQLLAAPADAVNGGVATGIRSVTQGTKTVGYGYDANYNWLPVVWNAAGTPSELSMPANYTHAGAFGINAYGRIIGAAYDDYGNMAFVVWDSKGVARAFPIPESSSNVQNAAMFVNKYGQVAVNFTTYSGADSYRGDIVHGIQALSTLSNVNGLNDRGALSGTATAPNGEQQAAVLSSSGITFSGALPTLVNAAYAINDAGEVVGQGDGPDFRLHAYAAPFNQLPIDLITLPSYSLSGASAVSTSGIVVGSAYSWNSNTTQSFVYAAGNLTFIGGAGSSAAANGVNSNGQVAGTDFSKGQAFLWDPVNGLQYPVGTLPGGGFTNGNGINSAGHITGSSGGLAYIWDPINGIRDLGLTASAYGAAINDSDQIAGYYARDASTNTVRAFLWDPVNGATDLGNIGGYQTQAWALNQAGQVVGSDRNPSSFDTLLNSKAFLYSSGRMIDLNTVLPSDTSWTLSQAFGINDNGQIVGIGSNDGGVSAFVLTPQVKLNALSLSAVRVQGGTSVMGTVTFSKPVPYDLPVSIASTSTAASAPAWIIVPGGSKSTTFTIATTSVPVNSRIEITAGFARTKRDASFTILH